MAEQVEWRSAQLRSVHDVTPDIRLFEIVPAGDFVAPTPGSHFNFVVGHQRALRRLGPIRLSALVQTASTG